MEIKNLINEKELFLTERGLEINYLNTNYLLIEKSSLNKQICELIDNKKYSLIQLIEESKKMGISNFKLDYPERFGQLVLHNYIYHNWAIEKTKNDNQGKNDRYDLYLEYLGKFISLIEIKNYELFSKSYEDAKNFQKSKSEYKEQLRGYIVNHRDKQIDDNVGNYFSLIIMDCNYIFNNPHVIIYLSDIFTGSFIQKDQEKIIEQEVYLVKKNKDKKLGLEHACDLKESGLGGGIVSLLEVDSKDYKEIPDADKSIRQISTATCPINLSQLESDTNVRDLDEPSAEIIKNSILEDIKEVGVENYFARTSGTGDKHVSIKGDVLVYKYICKIESSKDREVLLIAGLNIDEFNGQHSTNAYKKIKEDETSIIENIIKNPKYNSDYSRVLKSFKPEQLFIPIKIFPYSSLKELNKIKENSNFSVGKPELNKSKHVPLLKHINRELIKNDLLIQIDHPKKRKIEKLEIYNIKYKDIFQYMNRFIHAYSQIVAKDDLKTNGVKIRNKQVTKSMDEKFKKFFYNIHNEYENYRNYDSVTKTSSSANLKTLIKKESLLIKCYEDGYGSLEDNEKKQIEMKDDGNYYIKDIGGSDPIPIIEQNYKLAYQYRKIYEKELMIRENSQDFKVNNVNLFYFCLAKFSENYKKIENHENDKDTIYLNVFYFAIKEFLKYALNKNQDKNNILNQINSFDFINCVQEYRNIFLFIKLMPDNNLPELGVLNSPAKYGLDDKSIEEMYNNKQIPSSNKGQKMIDIIKSKY